MKFNIRVYGILFDEKKGILVSDEFIQGNFYTKFCGGGLEFGEGTRECLQREFMEEANLQIEVGKHIYSTDFFMASQFAKEQQVISIYYEVFSKAALPYPQRNEADNNMFFHENDKGDEQFRFIEHQHFNASSVSLPADKVVAEIIAGGLFGRKV